MLRLFPAMLILISAATSLAETITVSAAISLKEPLQTIAADFQAVTGHKVVLNLGASGQLMAQIQQGAPVDAFISASPAQTAQLRKDGLAADVPDRTIARNRLVLIIPSSAGGAAITSFADLARPATTRIAIGQPKTVPAGDYALQALDTLSLTSATRDRLIFGANVRQVLDYVSRGEVDAGIVYATDAREAGDKVGVVAIADPDWHKPIVYPAVILRNSTHSQTATAFIEYLLSPRGRAQATLAQCGFEVATP